MIRLSDQARTLRWGPFGAQKELAKKNRAVVYFTAATSLDIDLAKNVAEEMARQLVNGGAVLAELGLTQNHSDNFVQMLLAAQENPDAANKTYERFLLGVALAELKVTKVKGIEAPDGSPFDITNRSHFAALLRNPSRCAEWRGWVLAPDIMEAQAGNASSAAPSGSTASAATSAKGVPTSATPAPSAVSAPTEENGAQGKPKNPKPSKKLLSGKSPKSPASGQA